MLDNKFISPLIPAQFPSFYRDQNNGQALFIAFVKAYYEWLEQPSNIGYQSRSLYDLTDIDNTEQAFISHFKNTYLTSIPETIISSPQLLVKHILDLYRSKGSRRSYELLFRLLFDEDIDVYIPNNYLLKPSDGIWQVPKYIEVNNNPYLPKLIGNRIYSSSGSAFATCENYYQKIENNKVVNVLYLSSLEGRFKYGEQILCEAVPEITLKNAPVITGSLTTISIVEGGYNFKVGDELNVLGSGSGARATVASTYDLNGEVVFTLVNGGQGISLNANVVVSGGSGAGATFKIGAIQDAITWVVNIDQVNNFSSTVLSNYTTIDANTTSVNAAANTILVGSANTLYPVGTYVYYSVPAGNTAIPSLTANSYYYVTFANSSALALSSSLGGANIALTPSGTSHEIHSLQYNPNWSGFFTGVSANLNTQIGQVLSYENIQAGAVSYLTGINPGAGYSSNPTVTIIEPYIAFLGLPDGSGGIIGEDVLVTATATYANGIVSAVHLQDSGFGHTQGELLSLSAANTLNQTVVTGTAVLNLDGTGSGSWLNNQGFVSDINFIQDSYLYQNMSYEIVAERMLSTYEKFVRDIVHPAGIALFGKYRYKDTQANNAPTPSSILLTQGRYASPYWIVEYGDIPLENNVSYSQGVLVDSQGNSYIVGSSNTSTSQFVFITKFDILGNVVWQYILNDYVGSYNNAGGIAIDSNDHIIVTMSETASPFNSFVLKLDSNGNVLWQKSINSNSVYPGFNSNVLVCVDASNNIYVTGTINTPSGSEYTLFKYDSSGNLLWQYILDTYDNNNPIFCMAVDASGNIYTSCSDRQHSSLINTITKTNTSGSFVWSIDITSIKLNNYLISSIDVDNEGNCYALVITSSGNNQLIKFNSSGTIVWCEDIQSSGIKFTGVSIDKSDNIWLVGSNSVGSITFAKMNTSGSIAFTNGLLPYSSDGSIQGYTYPSSQIGPTRSNAVYYNGAVILSGYVVDNSNDFNGNALIIKVPADGSLTSSNNTAWGIYLYQTDSELGETVTATANTSMTTAPYSMIYTPGTIVSSPSNIVLSNNSYTTALTVVGQQNTFITTTIPI